MKKFLAVFLALLLVISMLPAGGAVYAEGGGAEGGGSDIDVSNYVVGEPLDLPEGADLTPDTANFDKKLTEQKDIQVKVDWWNDVLTISGIKSGEYNYLQGDEYTYSVDSANVHFLTITKEYLARQSEGPLVFTVEFNGGNSARLTVNIIDSGDILPPSWPEASTLTPDNLKSDSVTLKWTSAEDDQGVMWYRIYQDDLLIREVGDYVNVVGETIFDLSPDTEYTFRVEAGDARGQWTSNGPSVTVKTLAQASVGDLGLNAPRYTFENHLFMGDIVKITMTASESGLSPKVTVSYKEWNEGRTAVEDKSTELTLEETETEILGDKKMYAADFELREGICQITSLAGQLKLDSSLYESFVNYRVAGRIELTVHPPAGLDSEQIGIFRNFLKGTSAVAAKTDSWVSFASEIKDPEKPNLFTIEGVSGNDGFQGAAYKFKHSNNKNYLIYEDTETVTVKDGLESVCQYSIDSFAHLKVRVVDEKTGKPIENAQVQSLLLVYVDGTKDYTLSARTGSDGYATTAGSYFVQHLKKAERQELTVDADLYESKVEITEAGSLVTGENIIEIRLKKSLLSHLKVQILDDATGKPIENAQVISPLLLYANGKRDNNLSARTGSNGYATTTGAYFALNLKMDAGLELIGYAPLYKSKTVTINAGSLTVGENTLKIRLEREQLATIKGKVTGPADTPLKQAVVRVPLKNPNGIDISVTGLTDENGNYNLQVPKTANSVSFSIYGTNHYKPLSLQDGDNILDVKLPLTPKVKVNLEAKDIYGNATRLDLNWSVDIHLRAMVWNKSKNYYGQLVDGYYEIIGDPGDEIRVYVSGIEGGYGDASVSVYLDENNYAEARLVITPYEQTKITARVTDHNGNTRLNDLRYMYLYDELGNLVDYKLSNAPGISYSLRRGGIYRVVFSWKLAWNSYLNDWESEPEVFISDSFEVMNGNATDLGEIRIKYSQNDPYFKQNRAAGVTSSQQTVIPGSVVTFRVGYDYDRLREISPDKLDLVAQIPVGTSLVEGSVLHRGTRGSLASVQPVISSERNSITLDLKNSIPGAAGVLTYQVRVNPAERRSITAGAELKFMGDGGQVSEDIGFVELPCMFITLNAPPDIPEKAKADPVILNGQAPANKIVELYDGSIKIGETQTTSTGVWSLSVTLPDRGMPIYHQLKARTVVDNYSYNAEAAVLVGSKGVEITEFVLRQGPTSVRIDPRHKNIEFPFVVAPSWGDLVVRIGFNDNNKVGNVKIAGKDAILQNGAFEARLHYTTPSITVEYDEEAVQLQEVLKYDFGVVPEYIREAKAEFTNSSHTIADTHVAYGADGYLSEFVLPEVKLSGLDGYGTVSMKLETAPFDPAKASNRTNLGNGLYGYDLSVELLNGKYVITGYLDRRLLPKQAFEVGGKQSYMRLIASTDLRMIASTDISMVAVSGVTAGLEFVKSTIEVAGQGESLLGAFGDLSKAGKMANLLNKYESVRPNIEPHLQEYYDSQIRMMGEDILMGKSLGFVQEGVGKAANLVPLAGQVVCGIAEFISGKLLGDMFDNEFESDYNRIISQIKNLPGSDNWYDNQIWSTYDPITERYRIPNKFIVKPRYIMDPSGYVYEGVEDNRLTGVTATALFLPKEKAATAAEAKDSSEWQVWDAGWYLQENPQLTDLNGRYAWDVPEGWWMVQLVKDGYQTAYSDALPVPPPQLDINLPMVQLAKPAVQKVIWGSGGRYVDIYFTKYMDTRSLEAVTAFLLTDASGNPIAGTISYPEGAKTGVDGAGESGLSLTKIARFIPSGPLTADAQYTLTVNRSVTDYAGFSLGTYYVKTETVAAAATIASLAGRDLTVEPGLDITANLAAALSFTAANPGAEALLDTRAIFASANPNVVSIAPDGKATSLWEGTAQITVTALDDQMKNSIFTVTVAYPPSPVRVEKMIIPASDGRALTDLKLAKGNTYSLNPVITPSDAANQTMNYFSDNPTVASVDANGRIQALAEGIALITAKTVDKNIWQTIHVTVTPAVPTDLGGSSGSGGGSAQPSASTVITAREINECVKSGQSFDLQFVGLRIAIDPLDLPALSADGDSIKIHTSIITEPKALNSFFMQYLGRQGIMKAFDVAMIRQRANGSTETVTQLKGDITLTFQLTPEELEGIDPSTLVVYKRAEDGDITEYTPEFDWGNLTLSISTSHLCEFYIMGEKGIAIHRLSGSNRYATAIAISSWGFKTSDYVILASGENFPDALAGTALAGVKNAPVLLSAKDIISKETMAEIKRLRAKNIYLLGGTSVISPQVEETLAREYNVVRIAGSDRYETAVRIGELVLNANRNGAYPLFVDTAVITAGLNYPDALSIAPFAGQYGLPILFTEQIELNALTSRALNQWGIKNVILVGGVSVISAGIEDNLRDEMKLNVTRLSGTDRYLTGLEIAKHFTADQYAALATGNNFPDALAGAALAAKLNMPVFLISKEKVSPEIRDYFQELDMKKLYIFGGQATITQKILEEISR